MYTPNINVDVPSSDNRQSILRVRRPSCITMSVHQHCCYKLITSNNKWPIRERDVCHPHKQDIFTSLEWYNMIHARKRRFSQSWKGLCTYDARLVRSCPILISGFVLQDKKYLGPFPFVDQAVGIQQDNSSWAPGMLIALIMLEDVLL